MKDKIYSSIALIFILLLSSMCTMRVNTLNQRAIRKCSTCENFLRSAYLFDAPYKEYNKGKGGGYSEIIDKDFNGSAPLKKKTHYMSNEDYDNLLKHKFCFNGMTKVNIEKKFGGNLEKISFPSISESVLRYDPENNLRVNKWNTSYHFSVGGPNEDSLITLNHGVFLLEYNIIGRDTLYKAEPNDLNLLKDCFKAEGVKYKE